MSSVQIAQIRAATRAEGPGKRVALWTQGCSIRCRGCFNPHLWESDSNKEHPVSFVIKSIEEMLALETEVEGLSFLGGEPFNQAGALAQIARYFRTQGYSITTFTGFTYETLLAQSQLDTAIAALLAETDLLIDGPFIENRLDEQRPWLGSTNQRYLFLTDKYSMKDIEAHVDSVEVTVTDSGEVLINGWAPLARLQALTNALPME